MSQTIHKRKNIRLKGFDYSSEGAYFITIVTKDREPLFGEIVGEEMVLNDLGKIVAEEWVRSAEIREEIEIEDFVVMPNHFHAVVYINNDDSNRNNPPGDDPVGATGRSPLQIKSAVAPTNHGPRPRSLGALMAGFKSAVTTRINTLRGTPGVPVWQRNYYDHIVGSDREYEQIAAYIADNPAKWLTDSERNPPDF